MSLTLPSCAYQRINPETGELSFLRTIKYELPLPDKSVTQYAAEIYMHPTLPVIYASNRVFGALLVFEIKDREEGVIELAQVTKIFIKTSAHIM